MRVVDTSAWIEWLRGTPAGVTLRDHIPRPEEWIVPTMVQLELAKWLTREMGDEVSDNALGRTQTLIVAPLHTSTAMLAAELSVTHRLSTADAVIYATTHELNAELLTCDAHFEGLPRVIYVPNKPN
ncbi:MAG: type II toxin-antitoxin system VapC family toxin [Devosia sp.]